MADEYEVLELATEDELLKTLGVSDLAGSDVPDCSMGVILIRFKKDAQVPIEELSRVLRETWMGDLPVVLVSKSGFTPQALQSVSEYEDAHLFAPSV